MRNYAIILKDNDKDVVSYIASRIKEIDSECKVRIFERGYSKELPEWIEPVEVPEDVWKKDSMVHNFVLRWFLGKGEKGFLHVFRDGYEVISDRMSKFMPDIEEFMGLFGYDVWLNTYTDGCNFIFDKWISRINVVVDNEELKARYPKNIIWTSNANTNYIVYNMDVIEPENVLFDETFSMAMFYIIKFFAERRNRKLPGAFMNLYPTLESENGILKEVKNAPRKQDQNAREILAKEDLDFKAMNVDIHPTEHIEEALDFIINTLSK